MPPAARITDMHTCPMVNPGRFLTWEGLYCRQANQPCSLAECRLQGWGIWLYAPVRPILLPWVRQQFLLAECRLPDWAMLLRTAELLWLGAQPF